MSVQHAFAPEVRPATVQDIPFLARMDIEASSQPFGTPYWAEMLAGTDTTPQAFVAAMLRENASNWGKIEDFLILEVDGQPAATCCVFRPDAATSSTGPLNLNRLAEIGWSLGWTTTQTAQVRAKYLETFGDDADYLRPQADLIVETVAVDPGHRGKGLGTALMKAAFARGRALGAESIGIMVIQGNDNAQALYDKHFEPYATFHAAYFDHEFPGLTKYRASLTSEKE
ncbi:MAG: GNAT family N-acetyltransferase [Pseudomonadota bacterium]